MITAECGSGSQTRRRRLILDRQQSCDRGMWTQYVNDLRLDLSRMVPLKIQVRRPGFVTAIQGIDSAVFESQAMVHALPQRNIGASTYCSSTMACHTAASLSWSDADSPRCRRSSGAAGAEL